MLRLASDTRRAYTSRDLLLVYSTVRYGEARVTNHLIWFYDPVRCHHRVSHRQRVFFTSTYLAFPIVSSSARAAVSCLAYGFVLFRFLLLD